MTLSNLAAGNQDPTTNILMLHEALDRLAEVDPERARLVELRFFGDLTIEETAAVLGKSSATVKRSWEVARGWLFQVMNKGNTRWDAEPRAQSQ